MPTPKIPGKINNILRYPIFPKFFLNDSWILNKNIDLRKFERDKVHPRHGGQEGADRCSPSRGFLNSGHYV